MTCRVHLGVTALVLIEQPLSLPLVIGGIIGSYLPDSDSPKAIAGWIFPTWLITKHRSVMHSWLMCIIFSALACIFDYRAGIGLFVGYSLHLLLDACTPMGLPKAFWPYKKI